MPTGIHAAGGAPLTAKATVGLAPWLRATLYTMIGPAISNTPIGTNTAMLARTLARR